MGNPATMSDYSDIIAATNIPGPVWSDPKKTSQEYIDAIKEKVHKVYIESGQHMSNWPKENFSAPVFCMQVNENGYVLFRRKNTVGGVIMHFQATTFKMKLLEGLPPGLYIYPKQLKHFMT